MPEWPTALQRVAGPTPPVIAVNTGSLLSAAVQPVPRRKASALHLACRPALRGQQCKTMPGCITRQPRNRFVRYPPTRVYQRTRTAIVKESLVKTKTQDLERRQKAPLVTPTDLTAAATKDITGAMNAILADAFALYLKTKNFHWHMSGPHFRDYHLLLNEQADQIYAMTDPIAARVRKMGGPTLKSIGHIARTQRIKDNDADYGEPLDMLAELREDNITLAARLREVHDMVDELRDIATASLIENWIDETERRTWFLYESSRRGDRTGH